MHMVALGIGPPRSHVSAHDCNGIAYSIFCLFCFYGIYSLHVLFAVKVGNMSSVCFACTHVHVKDGRDGKYCMYDV